MKKIIFIVIILVFYLILGKITEKGNIIPSDAIRIRILANSNSKIDQNAKNKVKEGVEIYLFELLKNANTVEEADYIIKSNMSSLEGVIENIFDGDYTVHYGMNYFPKKEYKGILYEAGYYNSLVVSLGEGVGNNWWCILFPPLCMLEGTEMEDVEYRSLVSDIINKYF